MAFPTIPTAAGSRILFANQADASGTRTFPSLSSLTKNSGDLLIAIAVAYQDAGVSGAIFSSWGGSFTEFSDQMTTSGSTMCIGLAYKWSTGSETGTFTVTQASPTGHASMCLLSIAGAHASTPPAVGTIANGTSAAAGASGGVFIAGSNAATSITTALTANITGNVSGSVASVTADVGITQAAADKVWGSAARTLTSFGTLVADTATAIWGAVTRTLTAGTNIGTVNADVKKINGVTITGDGSATPFGV